MIDPEIPASLAPVLERELDAGEQLLWHAQPAPWTLIERGLSKFIFGIFFFGFAVFWTWGASGGLPSKHPASTGGMHWFGLIWGTPFMLVGASMVLSPLWAWWVARRTLYVITNRRAILIEAPFRRKIQSFRGDRLINVLRDENQRGNGNLIFEREASQGSKGRTIYRDIGFFGLIDAKSVEDLLRRTYLSTDETTSRR
jgi:hypothetical protein